MRSFTEEELQEINRSYINAKNKFDQIKILADLYICSPTDICDALNIQDQTKKLRRKNMLRRLTYIQREVQEVVEDFNGVLDITSDEVLLTEQMFYDCFASYRREPLENNSYASARLVGYAGGVRFCTYIEEVTNESETSA
jgi:hypothetical protein